MADSISPLAGTITPDGRVLGVAPLDPPLSSTYQADSIAPGGAWVRLYGDTGPFTLPANQWAQVHISPQGSIPAAGFAFLIARARDFDTGAVYDQASSQSRAGGTGVAAGVTFTWPTITLLIPPAASERHIDIEQQANVNAEMRTAFHAYTVAGLLFPNVP